MRTGKVKKKNQFFYTIFLLLLLFITLLRSQILTFLESGFTSNPPQPGVGADDTKSAPAIAGWWFTPATGRQGKYTTRQSPEDYNKKPIAKEAGGAVLRRDTLRPPGVSWLDKLLDKIWLVESSGRTDPPDGDGGKAVGPLQIHQCVLDDVNEKYGMNFTIDDCREIESAKLIVKLYITMWMDAYKEEIAARIFNGGPRGWRKKSTDAHWRKIEGQK